MFLFLKSIISDLLSLWLFDFSKYTDPFSRFRKIDMATKDSGGLSDSPRCSGAAVMPWMSL